MLAAASSSDDDHDPAISQTRTDLAALKTLNDNVQMAIATSLVSREQYADAIEPLETYLATPRKDIGGEKARTALAICLAQNHRAEEAVHVFNELQEVYPDSKAIASTTFRVAEAAYAAADYASAAKLYSQLADDSNPNEMIAKGLSGLGWCHYQAGENEAAEAAFGRFLDRFPTDPRAPDVALARGQTLEHCGKSEAALAVVRQALKHYPKAKQLPELMLATARLCDRLGHDDEAVILYERIVREFPKNTDNDAVLYGLAWSQHDLGHGDDAEKTFRRIYQTYPNSRFWADASYRLAERASERGERDAADALLTPLIDGECPAPGPRTCAVLAGANVDRPRKMEPGRAVVDEINPRLPRRNAPLTGRFLVVGSRLPPRRFPARPTALRRLGRATDRPLRRLDGDHPVAARRHRTAKTVDPSAGRGRIDRPRLSAIRSSISPAADYVIRPRLAASVQIWKERRTA